MSQTTIGPKGAHRPNTAIAGTAIAYGTAVKRGVDQYTLIQATAGSLNLGIAIEDQPTIGQSFDFVDVPGENMLARSGAAFALDDPLMSDASGRLIVATSGSPITAYALEAAPTADRLVPVRLAHRGALVP